ncbi:MAG: hypothetical protein ACKPJJ_20235, partial [Planctomycetaceae bacterium]
MLRISEGVAGGQQHYLRRDLLQAGSLSLVSDEVICLQSRRTLTVLDAETGEVRWKMKGGRTGTSVAGGDRLVYLSAVDAQREQQMLMMRGLGVPV